MAQHVHSEPPLFTPRYNAGAIVAGNMLYVVAGTLSVSPSLSSDDTSTSDDTLAIPLNAPFTMKTVPWKKLSSGYMVPEANALAATLDQKHLVLAGVSNQVGQLVVVYEIDTDSWSYLPPTAVSKAFPATDRSAVGLALDASTGQMVLLGGLEFSPSSNSTAAPSAAAPALGVFSVSTELDILDTRSDWSTWTWSAVINNPTVPTSPTFSASMPLSLVQPILVYLPTVKATLIMGGCNGINPSGGNVTFCREFDHGYLINSMVTAGTTSPAMVPISPVTLTGAPLTPQTRISPCVVLLPSGKIFMYGGASMTGSLSDAWLLDPQTWIWTTVQVTNMPIPGRAGAACQMGAKDQLILIGGFDGGLTGPRQFSDPQLAVINTTSWTWTQIFTPDSMVSTNTSGQLSSGVIDGIVAGCLFLFAVALFFLVRWYLARRYRREAPPFKDSKAAKSQGSKFYQFSWWAPLPQINDTKGSPSEEHRMLTMENIGHGTRASSSTDVSFPPPPPVIASRPAIMSSPHGTPPYPIPPKSKDKSPFLIIPYAPPDSPAATFSTLATLTTTDSTLQSGYHGTISTNASGSAGSSSGRGAGSTLFSHAQHQQRIPHPSQALGTGQLGGSSTSFSSSSSSSSSVAQFSKGDRLPQDLADIQLGFYNRTLQHNKHYDMRRQNEIREHPELDRSGTVYSLLRRVEAEDADADNNRKGKHLQRQREQQPSRQRVNLYNTRADLNNPDSTATLQGTQEPSTSTMAATATATAATDPLSSSISTRSLTFPSNTLKEIEVGEEPIQGEWNGVEDGTLLMSSHLETTSLTVASPPAPPADGSP
ncbi:hypothetical protein EMPS_11129 [Entomortierella parvispora]|uniref:Galactose oxidase n=1 Tax=Entomortierella parvispora TaxID=205924 RepID=A0A9P3HLH5_9FUNG|nr:hypothetical protein EMPS_11129 [Entomortierella parvispora]